MQLKIEWISYFILLNSKKTFNMSLLTNSNGGVQSEVKEWIEGLSDENLKSLISINTDGSINIMSSEDVVGVYVHSLPPAGIRYVDNINLFIIGGHISTPDLLPGLPKMYNSRISFTSCIFAKEKTAGFESYIKKYRCNIDMTACKYE